ncbi:hypothetical protein B0H34DRAFT_783174 [Crassisporium funariophilum]|nr:hypothetical protein B0H34DRAFT_783174 [Crassisporium funariophilum]
MVIDCVLDGTIPVDLSHEDYGLANNNPKCSSHKFQEDYPVEVLDTSASTQRKVALRKGDTSVTAAFLREGLVPCAPHLPTVAVTICVLGLYRNASLRCPHLAINSFVKSLCDLYGTPFRPYLCKQFSICFDVYLSIQNCVDQHLQTALKCHNSGWRLCHVCPCCTHKLVDEPKLVFDMLVTMDGNDSFKHVQCRKAAPVDPGEGDNPLMGQPNERKDERTVGAGYYIPRKDVDRWERDIVLQWIKVHGDQPSKGDKTTPYGGFLSFCWHGFVLVIIDMVVSGELSKYPLATAEALLDAFGVKIGGGYVIGCKFGITLARSPLGPRAQELKYKALVGSFYKHTHNRLCQLCFLATYAKGMGLEDLKGGEQFFSKSNALASAIQHTSVFHWKQKIVTFVKHMDQNKTYQNLSEFLVNNYRQSLNILNGEAAFVKQMANQNIANTAVFPNWLAEEKAYLECLSREPLEESLSMKYWQKLVNLGASKQCLTAAVNTWKILTPATITNTRDCTQSQERERQHAQEVLAKDLLTVQNLEIKMGIQLQWGPSNKEWKQAATMVGKQWYQRCLNSLEGLIVARMFELTKMNMLQTGNALKACLQAVRTALQNYNIAAVTLVPPRPPLLWDNVIEYAFLADFDLLSDTRSDMRLNVWAKPASRVPMDQYFKMEHAREGIVRLNEAFLLQQEELMSADDHPLSCQLRLHCLKLIQSNNLHIHQLTKLALLPGFSGTIAPGISVEAALYCTEEAAHNRVPAQEHTGGDKETEEYKDELAGADVADAFCLGENKLAVSNGGGKGSGDNMMGILMASQNRCDVAGRRCDVVTIGEMKVDSDFSCRYLQNIRSYQRASATRKVADEM